jgi:hypothetical protein
MDRIFLYEPLNRVSILQQMMTNSLSFVYYGNFTNRVNDALIPLAESLIAASEVELKIRKRAFYIFVECVQNVNRHQFRGRNIENPSREIFMIRENKDRFNIALGNHIKKKEKSLLKGRIDKLNDLSTDALNAHYKMVLEENVLTHRGGAGLGLIEVARKSGSKMKYGFENELPDCAYFTMETNINETDVHYSYPNYESVRDIGLLKRFYRAYEMGLILKNKNKYFTKSHINKLVLYLNALGDDRFFSHRNTGDRMYDIIHAFKDRRLFPRFHEEQGLVVHFFRNGRKKYMTIGWPVHMKSMQFDMLNTLLSSDQPLPGGHGFTSLVSAASNMRGRLDEQIVLDLLPAPEERSLLLMQIPVG